MIPTVPRYDIIYEKACAFLQKIGANSLPVNPFAAIAANGWALVTYSKLSAELPIPATLEEIAEACRSKDGATVFSGTNYCIAYNETVRVKSRIAFTLMHEAGHIACGHFDGRHSRSSAGLCLAEYKVLEDEANFFAANVLAPAAVVTACGLLTPELLKAACGISYSAAKSRLPQLNVWQPRPADDAVLRAFSTYIAVTRRRAGQKFPAIEPDCEMIM